MNNTVGGVKKGLKGWEQTLSLHGYKESDCKANPTSIWMDRELSQYSYILHTLIAY